MRTVHASIVTRFSNRYFNFRASSLVAFAVSFVAGVTFCAAGLSLRNLLALTLGAGTIAVFLFYPELALALYVVIGDLKGDERIASLFPVDLTIVIGAIILAGIALNLLRGKRIVRIPGSFLLYIALVALMVTSLAYTPVFDAGLEKLGRFLTVTALVIVAPFFVLTTPQAIKRFFAAFAIVAFLICGYSLTDLGSSSRLVTPSNNTIGLGHIACSLILLIWLVAMPQLSFLKRMAVYPLLAVPAVALIGSGSRGAVIAVLLVIVLSLLLYRQLIVDLTCLLALGFLSIPLLRIPEASFEYLGTLFNSRNVEGLLSFRAELLGYGWSLFQQHPLMGVGIQGFRYYSPNAGLYNWPHNIFLEIGCELGIPALLLVLALFGSAIREALRQLRDKTASYLTLAHLSAALLLAGIVNSLNTGDINSDRSTWLFVSLIFLVGSVRSRVADPVFEASQCAGSPGLSKNVASSS
jgi:O-antigen ligase